MAGGGGVPGVEGPAEGFRRGGYAGVGAWHLLGGGGEWGGRGLSREKARGVKQRHP